MQRVNVIGSSASGKSTFSKQLAARSGCPYIEMDRLFWQADWQETDDETFFSKISQATDGDAWVLDGNYSRTQNVKWQHVDTIIWLDYSRWRTTYRAVKRAWMRSWTQQELWPGTGNRESFSKSFFSRDSIIWWSIKNYRKNRVKYLLLKEELQNSPICFVHLTTPKMAEQFLHQLK
ncbi:adenylate kinase [Vibrio navarrensis]|uniref:adenylate kinase n=1 Tax=Vibrio navarrensis TaxID=29495 RepID=UPI001869F68E|nr:adenylate kinase [Vibrio navarrensis]MBE4591034.1 adenylate kinase [Vibrio navarrensis]